MEELPEIARGFFIEQDFCVLDLETTGTNAKDANAPDTEACEIAIVASDGTVLLNSLIKPMVPIPQSMTDFHGISNEMVASAPTFETLWPHIVEILKDKTVVVYNAEYDITLLEKLAQRHGFGHWTCFDWCLLRAYADYRKVPGKRPGGYKWHKLADACAHEGVVLTDAHRALGDTLATSALLRKLASKA